MGFPYCRAGFCCFGRKSQSFERVDCRCLVANLTKPLTLTRHRRRVVHDASSMTRQG